MAKTIDQLVSLASEFNESQEIIIPFILTLIDSAYLGSDKLNQLIKISKIFDSIKIDLKIAKHHLTEKNYKSL